MPELVTPTGAIYYEVLVPDQGPPPGETVVLLHNFMSTGRMAWGSIAEGLRAGYRVILPDLPGHGRSHGYPPGFDHHAMAEQIAVLLHAEGVETPHLAGCSAGGMLALWMVHDGHVVPATLTLVSTTYSTNPATTGVTASLHPENFRAGRAWLEATALLHDPHQGEGYFDSVLLPSFRRLTPTTSIDLPPTALQRMAMPAYVIHGDEDEIFPVSLAQQMADELPDAELSILPGQSHALIFRRPWKVGELMREFLARHPSSVAASS